VVSRAKAIVDEIAVMVVVCTATIANGAVEGAVRLYKLVEDAQVVQVNVIFQKVVHQPDEVELLLQIAWRHKYRYQVGDHRDDKEKACEGDTDNLITGALI